MQNETKYTQSWCAAFVRISSNSAVETSNVEGASIPRTRIVMTIAKTASVNVIVRVGSMNRGIGSSRSSCAMTLS